MHKCSKCKKYMWFSKYYLCNKCIQTLFKRTCTICNKNYNTRKQTYKSYKTLLPIKNVKKQIKDNQCAQCYNQKSYARYKPYYYGCSNMYICKYPSHSKRCPKRT